MKSKKPRILILCLIDIMWLESSMYTNKLLGKFHYMQAFLWYKCSINSSSSSRFSPSHQMQVHASSILTLTRQILTSEAEFWNWLLYFLSSLLDCITSVINSTIVTRNNGVFCIEHFRSINEPAI